MINVFNMQQLLQLERNKLSMKNRCLENEKNNPTIAFNILYTKEKEIYTAYI